jgi:hypothetical protein
MVGQIFGKEEKEQLGAPDVIVVVIIARFLLFSHISQKTTRLTNVSLSGPKILLASIRPSPHTDTQLFIQKTQNTLFARCSLSSTSQMPTDKASRETATFCYIDFDWDDNRSKLRRAAAFVNATDKRYGFSSKDVLKLGGAELANRVKECYDMDHDWSNRGSIITRPPRAGNRIVIQLFWDQAPLACENFATLCENGSHGRPAPLGQSGKPLTYRGSNVHRIVPGFILQGGDFVMGNGSGT